MKFKISDSQLVYFLLWSFVCAILSAGLNVPLSDDEFLHLRASSNLLLHGVFMGNGEAHPPAVGLWAALPLLFCSGPLPLRLFSILMGALAILACFSWLKNIGRSVQAAATASLLSLSSGMMILVVQLRTYGALLLLFFGSLWAADRFHQTRKRGYFWFVAGATNLGLATHFGYPFLGLSVLLYLAYRFHGEVRLSVQLQAAALCTGPGIILVAVDLYQKWNPAPNNNWWVTMPLSYLQRYLFDARVSSLRDYLYFAWLGQAHMWVGGAGLVGAAVLTALGLLTLAWAVRSYRRNQKEDLVWIGIFGGPLILAVLAALFSLYPFGPIRQCFFVLASGSVLATLLTKKVRRYRQLVSSVVLFSATLVLVTSLKELPLKLAWGAGTLLFLLPPIPSLIWTGSKYRFAFSVLVLFLMVRNPTSKSAQTFYTGVPSELKEAQQIQKLIQTEAADPRLKLYTQDLLPPLSYYNEGISLLAGTAYPLGKAHALPPALRSLPISQLRDADVSKVSGLIRDCQTSVSHSFDRCFFILWRVWEGYPLEGLYSRFEKTPGVRVFTTKNWFLIEAVRSATRQ